ncbi:DUF3551 domain-containing protein [Tardiphaga sp.]|jgi:hypothetical protein|uniref:DUF3551 domain-containing protein n=1 Tax=Tardiphaga sp. TaxID=1926292 RepID=UPI0037D9E60D
MRKAFLDVTARSHLAAGAIFAASILAGAIGGSNASLAGANLPYCTAGDNDLECDYVTFRQCMATAQNTGQSCMTNPGNLLYVSSGLSSGAVRDSQASASTEAIRQDCIARAQARYPDSGLGTVTVMTQRTEVYRDCARANGINP